MKKVVVCAGFLALGMGGQAHAAIYDRGNGMVYDSDQNITWLQNANYAQTSGYDADGKMSWDQAMAWADSLVYEGYDDWRLPTLNDDGSGFSYLGTVYGFNTDTSLSEFAYMFHDILGNESWWNPGPSRNYSGCPSSTCVQSTSADGVDILSLRSDTNYWLGTPQTRTTNTENAWTFGTLQGHQGYTDKDSELLAWAVRNGDINPVPVPAAVWLFSSGLLGLAGLTRRKRKS